MTQLEYKESSYNFQRELRVIHTLTQWLLDTIGAMGYPGILLLMAMESSIIPVPSELVMPPAGYLAYQGKMNMAVVILCGIPVHYLFQRRQQRQQAQ